MQQTGSADRQAARQREEPPAGFPRRAFQRWTQAAHAVGTVQTRSLLLVIYAVVVLPIGVAFRTRQDPLRLRQPAKKVTWIQAYSYHTQRIDVTDVG